jgi:hypothetical protein
VQTFQIIAERNRSVNAKRNPLRKMPQQ